MAKKTKKTCENYEKQDENIEKAMQKLWWHSWMNV